MNKNNVTAWAITIFAFIFTAVFVGYFAWQFEKHQGDKQLTFAELIKPEKKMLEKSQSDPLLEMVNRTSTDGDYSWLPIGRPGIVGEEANAKMILHLKSLFKAKHPELEIISYRVESSPERFVYKARIYGGYIYGLWIDHRPKNTSPPLAVIKNYQ